MKHTQLTLYAFLALSLTVLTAACAPPDSGPTGTPAKPIAPKKEEPPEPPKSWNLRQLTKKQSRVINGLSVDPHTSVLSVMAKVVIPDPVVSIMIRRFSMPSSREDFPVRFYTGRGGTTVPGSENLGTKAEVCGRSPCISTHSALNDVVFDSKGKVYILDSTHDNASSSRAHIRIIAFTKNVRNNLAHPREVLAGGSYGGRVDGTGTNANFNEGVRNMALSTDEKYIYVADWKNNSVRAVEIQNKKVTTLKPTDKEGKAVGLPAPTGIAVGKGNTVYTISNSGGVGTIAALTVPLPLPADNVVRARVLTLIDEKGKEYHLRDNPVWYIAVDDNGVLYSHIQRDGARHIVRIRLKDANAEDLVGVVSVVGAAKHVSTLTGSIRGLEVSGDGKTIYYTNGSDVYAYTYE